MKKLVLLRHGESIWNKENLFTGWMDVDLSDQGLAEARRAGGLLKAEGLTFDVAFTSVLKRRSRWIESPRRWRTRRESSAPERAHSET